MALERMIITCGGTGGHFYPGLAIAKEFQDRGGKVILLLSGVNAEKQSEIARSQGVGAECLPMMPHPLKKPFKFLSGLFGGISGSRRVIKHFAPQAILGMGSFASLPPIAARETKRASGQAEARSAAPRDFPFLAALASGRIAHPRAVARVF